MFPYPIIRLRWLRGATLSIDGYLVMLAVAWAVALALFSRRASTRKILLPHQVLFVAALSFGGGLLSSYLTSSLIHGHGLGFAYGSNFLGWVLGAVVATGAYCRLAGVRYLAFLDATLPATLVGSSIGRVGCLFGGCCHGCHADPPLGIYLFRAEHGVPGYYLPTPLLSAMLDMAVAVTVLLLERRRALPVGRVAAIAMVLYGTCRFTVEWLRLEPRVALGLTAAQLGCIVVIALSTCLLGWRRCDRAAPTSYQLPE